MTRDGAGASLKNRRISSTLRRLTKPTTISTMENRNGRRQPQAMNCSRLIDVVTMSSVALRRDDHADRRSDLWESTEEAATMDGGMLHRHQSRPAPLSTGGETLQDAQHDQEDRGPSTDLRVGRQQSDERSGRTHSTPGS